MQGRVLALSDAFHHWINSEGGVDFGYERMLRSREKENGKLSRIR